MSYEDAVKLTRAARYAGAPDTIFDDFRRGKVTTEGLHAAKTLVPESFARFQAELLNQVTEHMMRSKRLDDQQRLRVNKLLGYPTDDGLKRLQGNMMQSTEPEPSTGGAPAKGGNPKVDMQIHQTGFDAIEARKSG
jgi:hypothetical protein